MYELDEVNLVVAYFQSITSQRDKDEIHLYDTKLQVLGKLYMDSVFKEIAVYMISEFGHCNNELLKDHRVVSIEGILTQT